MVKDVSTSNQVKSLPKYISVVNALRGFASVIVCIFHLICLPLGFLENSFIYQIAPFGKYGVQIFFVITGVVIPLSLINSQYNYSKFGKFMLKRIIRIEPPYLFSIIAAVLFILLKNYFLTNSPHSIPSAANLLLHIGYLIPFFKDQHWFIIVFWTMAVEFQFYILISLIFPLLTHQKLPARLFIYCLIFGSASIFTNQEFTLVWLPVFMMGIIYINLILEKIKKLEFILILAVSSCFSFFLLGFTITFVSVITLAVIHFFASYQNKLADFFGNISYSLYLTHTIFGSAVTNFFVPHVTTLSAKLLVVLFSFIFSVIAAYVFYLLIEKPSKKLASKIVLKAKPEKVRSIENFSVLSRY